MKDLISLDTAVPDYVDEDGVKMINFRKMMKLKKALRYVYDLRNTAPNMSPKKELFAMLRVRNSFLYLCFLCF